MTLPSLRKHIDQVDRQLLRLLNQRARLALQVGGLKARRGAPIFDGRREAAIVRRLLQANGGPLRATSIREIFREILRHSRELEASATTAVHRPPSTVHRGT